MKIKKAVIIKNIFNILFLLIFIQCTEEYPLNPRNNPYDPSGNNLLNGSTPFADAGNDTSVSIKDTVTLHAGTVDSFPREVVHIEWNIDNTGFIRILAPDTNIITPSEPDNFYRCILKIIDKDKTTFDDYEYISIDTVTIHVLLDPPIPGAYAESSAVSINDTIRLDGTPTDVYGEITKIEWDIGNEGTFVETTPETHYTTVASSIADSMYQCVLRVTDDDSNVVADTVTINVLLDAPVPSASTTTPTVSINDTIKYQGSAVDGFGTIIKWEWDAGNTGTFIETTPDSSFVTIAPPTPDTQYYSVLRVTDDDGNVVEDMVYTYIQLDAPVPTASTTTPNVIINDSIRLQGTATDRFGTIVKWEWDVGGTGTFFETTPDSCYTILAPSVVNSNYPCVLQVTDDDGFTGTSTVIINVKPDWPIPTASTTTPTVSINDTVQLQGTATDLFGYITKWEWDVGNTGTFIETTPDSCYTALAPSVEDSAYPFVLKVTDNDGNIGLDTVTIEVLLDLPVATASTTTPSVPVNGTIQLKGTGTDAYGIIVKYEWKIGNSNWSVTSQGDTTFTAPSTEQAIICILRVTDDDELTDVDAVTVYVDPQTVADIDGNVYNTVRIGTQLWIVENLRTTKYNDGTDIPIVTDNSEWSTGLGACCYYNNTTNNDIIERYGALYNGNAINNEKLPMEGWHVPLKSDWDRLFDYLSKNGYNWDGSTSGHKFNKSLATKTDWEESDRPGAIGYDMSTNNRSGFSALPGGFRDDGGNFASFGLGGFFVRVSSEYPCVLNYEYTFPYWLLMKMEYGFSVRLVQD